MIRVLTVAGSVLVAINLVALRYFAAPLAVRVRHPLHAWFRPSGLIGQSLGILAGLLFLALWIYPLRKWIAKLRVRPSGVAGWLRWHVVIGLLVPFVAATHAGWRFTGMIGLGYLAMFIVFLSGLAGRYLYVHIPRRRDGIELNRDEIASERQRLLFELTAATGLPAQAIRGALGGEIEAPVGAGILTTLRALVADDLRRRRLARALERRIRNSGMAGGKVGRASLRRALKLARREVALAQQSRLLGGTHRALRYWHAAHRPVAIIALIAILAHIVVAITVGATWFS